MWDLHRMRRRRSEDARRRRLRLLRRPPTTNSVSVAVVVAAPLSAPGADASAMLTTDIPKRVDHMAAAPVAMRDRRATRPPADATKTAPPSSSSCPCVRRPRRQWRRAARNNCAARRQCPCATTIAQPVIALIASVTLVHAAARWTHSAAAAIRRVTVARSRRRIVGSGAVWGSALCGGGVGFPQARTQRARVRCDNTPVSG